MKSQPKPGYVSDDVVQTPKELAYNLVRHFQPAGAVLEPCCGKGNILEALTNAAALVSSVEWCEISEGRDFFKETRHFDWIFTNPPWSQVRDFLVHSMKHADNVVFILTINHVWTRCRVRLIREAGFRIEEICLFDHPPEFPATGFQEGAVHLKRGKPKNTIKFSRVVK